MNAGDVANSLMIYMLIGFMLGFLFGDPTGISGPLSMILLGFMMTISMSNIVLEKGESRRALRNGLFPTFLTFGLLTPVFIITSFFFEGELRLGWMLAAAVPAAVAIVPYSERLKGNVKLALHGEITIYLFALALTPIIAIVLLNMSVDVFELLKVLLLLILIPLGLSRIVRRIDVRTTTKNHAMNIAFLVFYLIVVGANRDIFFREPISVLILALASFITVFGVGLAVNSFLEWRSRIEAEKRTLTMFSTIKNTGLAIAVALSISRPEMAVPATMLVLFEMIWIIFLSFWKYNHGTKIP